MNSFQTRQPTIASQFLLDPDVAFFNHGSFGACPRPVFDKYQHWQRELERQPVDFIQRQRPELTLEARQKMGAYVGTDGTHVVFVPNATYGVNIAARSLKLQAGDEVLATDHEYGAVNNTWRYICNQSGATYINQPIPLPVDDPTAFVDALWEGVTPRTRVIAISHITSPTALILPVEQICARANAEGLLTVIDGAHALGQIDLDMTAMAPTFYTGNAHKWLCAPKGAAFLYVAPNHEPDLEPLVVSHGWSGETGSKLTDYYSWTGTMDPSAYLAVPEAIQFQNDHDWPAVRAFCHERAIETRNRIQDLTGLPAICPDDAGGGYRWFEQMFTARVPAGSADELRARLWSEFKVEVPISGYHDDPLIRVSIQAYNTPEQVDRLIGALEVLL